MLERIAVERTKQSDRPAIAVWFHPADKPSKAWRVKHAAEKREGGGFWIHRDDTNSPRAVNPERLRGPPKRYANAIYQDPHDIPDPGENVSLATGPHPRGSVAYRDRFGSTEPRRHRSLSVKQLVPLLVLAPVMRCAPS
ncbi:hypothetical protein [Streptomyces sp. SPB074]|uniref:hypothetical protein n=1 Tax=Streptomyces sp. (strain SPB074) TaxID=465543 RepID=UPI00017FEEA7|nr:hypothetical protein [Streptomyces sp. SPB074]